MTFFHNKGLATKILFGFTIAGAMIMSNLSSVIAAPTAQAETHAYYPTTETVAKVTAVNKMVQEQETLATAQERHAQQTANTAEQLANQKQQEEIAKKKAEQAKKVAAAKKAATEKLAAEKAEQAKVEAQKIAKQKAEQQAKENAAKAAAQKATVKTTAATQPTKTTTTNNTTASTATGSDASAKATIASRESGGSYTARNGQYVGKYQLSASYLNGDYSPANQERVANSYVTSRYGSWSNALAHWNANGWY
ncbi:hypothetical protein FC84_GL000003 [Lapidilactobacillus dextrinicus DSM 20335]|uniref:Aggregation promoting factor n=1 Tax=Lapidilactobacillus dextrinicus DSM 20335 TaxID=1423738 RepID=A0A0R2BTP0_9LACO|nr:hypothetical protein [Lapidilactobacillus dextrinicus]KRM78851.1 hypothetical protein FC84_GL000003 [Lapidilactobacillus dextrinicus DSM 20335]